MRRVGETGEGVRMGSVAFWFGRGRVRSGAKQKPADAGSAGFEKTEGVRGTIRRRPEWSRPDGLCSSRKKGRLRVLGRRCRILDRF